MDAPPWPVQGWGGTGRLETVFTEDTPGTLSAVHPLLRVEGRGLPLPLEPGRFSFSENSLVSWDTLIPRGMSPKMVLFYPQQQPTFKCQQYSSDEYLS